MDSKVTPIVIIILAVWVFVQSFAIGNSIGVIEKQEAEIEEHQEMVQEAQDRTEEALDTVDTWKAGYKELQEEHSQALEYIEQLEYELEWR